MIKVFTLNKNGKIELTKKQLEELLNESYWEGYRNKSNLYWTYTSPSITPCFTADNIATGTITTTKNPYTIDGSSVNAESITIKTTSN